VQNAALVRVMHRPRHRLGQLGRQAGRLGSAGEFLGKAAAFHQLRGKVRPAGQPVDVVDFDDMGVLQPGDRLGLLEEALQVLAVGQVAGPDHLQGHQALEAQLSGPVHHAHAAAAQLAQDLVAGDSQCLPRRRLGGDGRAKRVGRPHPLARLAGRQSAQLLLKLREAPNVFVEGHGLAQAGAELVLRGDQVEGGLAVPGQFGELPPVFFHPDRLPGLEAVFQIGVDQLDQEDVALGDGGRQVFGDDRPLAALPGVLEAFDHLFDQGPVLAGSGLIPARIGRHESFSSCPSRGPLARRASEGGRRLLAGASG
jgi:hypothetical protein